MYNSVNIPSYITNFSCYFVKVRFQTTEAFEYPEPWYHLPSYAMGEAMYNSPKYEYLYHKIFKPQYTQTLPNNIKPVSPLVIRVSKPQRRSFQAYEYIDIYITLIISEQKIVYDFLCFLQEWQQYHFFKNYNIVYCGFQLFNPHKNDFDANVSIKEALIDFSYFDKHKTIWQNALSIEIQTPTTLRIDGKLSNQIPYSVWINRISQRCLSLYSLFLSMSGQTSSLYEVERSKGILIESQVSLPHKRLLKSYKKYDLSGVLGKISYEVAYSEIDALLFSIARFVHIGQHTIRGNGHLLVRAIENTSVKKSVEKEIVKDKPLDFLSSMVGSSRLSYKEFCRERTDKSELIICQRGVFLGLSKGKVRVMLKNKILDKYSLEGLKRIRIMSDGVTISSDLIIEATQLSIPIIYFDEKGQVQAMVQNPTLLFAGQIYEQLNVKTAKKIDIATKIVRNKIKNQIKLLCYYFKYYQNYTEIAQILTSSIDYMKELLLNILPQTSDKKTIEYLFLVEGRAARAYWKGIYAILRKAGYIVKQRSKRGATDIVNQMLNYGYAILETEVLQSIGAVQISPYISYLHSSKDNCPTLCYDLMEQYRSFVVDRSIVAILTKGEFVEQDSSGRLSIDTRKKIISKINERFFATVHYKGEMITLSEFMVHQVESFYEYLTGDKRTFIFYNPRW